MLATKTVRTTEDLKQVVEDYLDFDEFAFDVETRTNRKVRGLALAGEIPKGTSRDAEQMKICPSCQRPFPPRHNRKFCTDECRDAAGKDKPALDPMTNVVWSISLAGPGRSDVIPCGHPDPRPQLRPEQVFDALEPLMFSDRRKVNQNVGFDLLSVSKYYDGEIPDPPYGDTLVAAFLLNENLGVYKLGALSKLYVGYIYAEKLGEEAYRVEFERAIRYSLVDAKMAWLLWWKLTRKLSKRGLAKLRALLDLEMEVLRVLIHMRQYGAYVDVEEFRRLRPELETRRTAAQRQAIAIITDRWDRPDEINLNSTQQLGHYFYDVLRIKCPKFTDKGARSTDAQTLRYLARRSPAAGAVLEYKDLQKLLSTYVAGYIPTIEDDNRIRASFNQAIARTGRLSCSTPNLQNIPARYKDTFEATMVRRLFVAPSGRKLIVADYSQIELRVLAHQCRDAKLMYAYTHDLDLHTQTAALIWRIPQTEVTPAQRSIAKNCNFNFAFEGGPGRVEEMSGISESDAEAVYKAWHRAYPGVKRWAEKVKDFCRVQGFVETLYGRKRRLKDVTSDVPKLRYYAERQAVNHPIQGTAADIAKLAIVAVHEALRGLDAHLVLQIHDEFIIECDERVVPRALPLVREAMEDIRLGDRPVLDVPLVANISVGQNWAECK
jgi:DNA polymerase I-like protein with 3'-5' exonuclease and polymerase domains